MSDFQISSGSGNATTAGGGQVTVSESGAPLTLTIEVSGDYDITADGAQGGADSDAGHDGGLGAAVGGDVFLTAGTELEIVAGGEGANGFFSGGGGGGSYVFLDNGGVLTLLEAAGGGGGGASTGAGGGGASHELGAGGAGSGAGFTGGGGGGGFTGGGGSLTGTGANGSMHATGFHGGAGTVTFGGNVGGAGGFGGGGGGGFGGGGGGGGFGGGHGGGSIQVPGSSAGGGGAGGGSYLNGNFITNPVEDGGSSAEGHSGDGVVIITALCFCSGTLIRTARGDVAVEELAVGDLAVTASGEARPIRWIGRRTVQPSGVATWPVRVSPGAFGENRPARDLWLSPGHAVCVSVMDEVFVPVSQLINGATIASEEVGEVTYWHVELDSHDVLLAEGLPCESYMDAGNRAFFEYGRLAAIDPERVAESITRYARTFVDQGPVVEAIRERLAARAEALRRRHTRRAA